MRVIDLLNKIANGEEVPEKIKYRNKIFIYDKDNQCYVVENYNEYDFYVTLNMIKSDNYELYKKRFNGYSDNQLDKLFIEDAINWLDDKDNPFGKNKIWKYLND